MDQNQQLITLQEFDEQFLGDQTPTQHISISLVDANCNNAPKRKRQHEIWMFEECGEVVDDENELTGEELEAILESTIIKHITVLNPLYDYSGNEVKSRLATKI